MSSWAPLRACSRAISGELHVVADGDAHPAEIGLERVELALPEDVPLLALEARHVDLRLASQLTGGRDEVADVEEVAGLAVVDGDRAADDVEIVVAGQRLQQLEDPRRLRGQSVDLLHHRPADVPQRQQLEREVLGEDHHPGPVVGGRLHQALHLVPELLERRDRTDVVLQRCDADRLHGAPGVGLPERGSIWCAWI